jgi:DNA polymerase-3 subunit epsilon
VTDFIAIDFETANEHQASACAVGLVFFDNGRISKEYDWLIRPHHSIDYFNPFNTRLHGISSRDVTDKPQFNEIWPEMYRLINNEILAAHNASFDMSVLRQLMDIYDLQYPDLEFVCTCNIARKTWRQLPRHTLNIVGDYLGYSFNHHNALADAEICGKILVEACTYHNCTSIDKLAEKIGMRVGVLNETVYYPCSVSNPTRSKRRKHETLKISELSKDNVNPFGVFSGKNVVFTGTLLSMNRQAAAQKVIDNGGSVSSSVSKRTDYLVMGVQDYAMFADGKQSSKTKKACQLIDQGSELKIIDEDEFLQVLEQQEETPQRNNMVNQGSPGRFR